MIIYHIADVHLGSKMQSLSPSIASKRKVKIFSLFSEAIKKAHEEGVKIILLPGDIFDEDSPKESDLNNFYQLISSYQDITFYYLRGNHDLIEHRDNIANLKYFSSSFSIYQEGNINIGAIEINDKNRDTFDKEISFPTEGYNILMLHGDIFNDIDIKKLANKNIDYIALGHIHTFYKDYLSKRTTYAYSGVFLGRGYDETGSKGYIKLNTNKNDIEFVASSKEIIVEDEIDISSASSIYEASLLIKDHFKEKNIILRLNLVGEIKFARPTEGIKAYLENVLEEVFLSLSIKDHTSDYIDIENIKNSKSFEGEFVRLVEADDSLTNDDKKRIIYLGINALQGEVK